MLREKKPHIIEKSAIKKIKRRKKMTLYFLKKLPDYHEGLASEFISEILNIYMHIYIVLKILFSYQLH